MPDQIATVADALALLTKASLTQAEREALTSLTKSEEPTDELSVVLKSADVPAAVKALLRKQAEETTRRDAEIVAMRKAETDRVEREALAKAESFIDDLPFLGLERDQRDGAVKALLELRKGDQTAAKAIEAALTGANANLSTSVLMAELGTSSGIRAGARGELVAKATELRKAESALTVEQAEAKVLESDPTLYARLEAEREGR